MSAGPGGRDDNPGGDRVGHSERDKPDGDRHHTLYDTERDDRISWDSDKNGDYRENTGHRRADGDRIQEQWPDQGGDR